MNRVDRIIELERDADHNEATADEQRWEAARLICEELATGASQRQLGRDIGKTQQHVSLMAKTWRIFGDNYSCQSLSFWSCYNSKEVRSKTVKPTPEPPEEPPRTGKTEGAGQSREADVRKVVRAHITEDGTPPSSRSVARELGLNDDRTVRAAWDNLAKRGQLPVRPGPHRQDGPPGQLLDMAIENVRGFLERVFTATDAEKESGTAYWLDRIGIIGRLTDEAITAINGDALETFLQEVREDN